MNQEKKELVYRIMISGQSLNKPTLLEYGYHEEEILTLIAIRMIECTTTDNYKLVSIEKFRQYGVRLLLEGKIEEANICFRKCYELAPTGRNIILQNILLEIIEHNYRKAFEIYIALEKIHPEKYDKDYNLYLYLLSFLIELPQEYINRIIKFTPDDLKLPGRGGNERENEIRDLIIQSKFKYAYKKINSMILRERQYSAKYELIRALLAHTIKRETKFKENLLDLIKKKNYIEIISILDKKMERSKLSKIETYILLITNEIIKLQQTQTLPIITNTNSYSLHEALTNRDFELAVRLNEEFLEYRNEDKEKDAVNLLLVDINQLITSIKSRTQEPSSKSLSENSSIEVIRPTKETNDTSMNEIDIEKVIKESEELAYYISSQNMTLDIAKRKIGLFPEQVELIKLIFARDHYIEGNYSMGDVLLKEVETQQTQTLKVITLLKEIKQNRDNYNHNMKQEKLHTRTLTQNQ